ncbi:MAG: hypothetical protein INR69_08360 [Mucilaginibacter polytrichastri]|nr:hypothetical protein [Mucilaginibacter polytrichastri]
MEPRERTGSEQTHERVDEGGEAVKKKEDKQYHQDDPKFNPPSPQKKRETDEQPVKSADKKG